MNHLEGFYKCTFLSPVLGVSDSVGLGETRECTFLTISQIMLKLLVLGHLSKPLIYRIGHHIWSWEAQLLVLVLPEVNGQVI